ncbi:AAA-ATPase ASD, mitochondrial-like isoform X2 [Rhododendron vialii]|uniref:AAA-ATPase ASD, mitochondrial-like isoform X2 n=1 Tax=Rhododendron vialii TaxID=182163 RepID=UPI00265FDF02|nr:AAA-ATPase ASD, mitochondrial-like isoform X2 [Rhododendron vialii]
MTGGEMWTQIGSSLAGLMFIWAMFKQYCPFEIEGHLQKYTQKLISLIYPYIHITFHEFTTEGFYERSKAYTAIERYLLTNSSTRAKRLKADMVRDSKSLVLSMDDYEEIVDEFKGIKVWWASSKNIPRSQVISFYGDEEKRFYVLKFHRRHREIVNGFYLNHVMEEGKAIEVKTRKRKLYTNNRSEQWAGYQRTMWSHVVFEHPATFDTLAMEETKKKQIMNDLITFTKSKDYYKKIGKAWKRGYLLFGPPGTGKSTMIAAMANLLEYDVYDLELTAVKDNTELRKLLIETSNKSIIVIEDIDCSLDLTGQRKKKEEKEGDGDGKDPVSEKKNEDDEKSKESSKVTLSGLLNFIDGLWSACGGERIIVFTTNYVEKLDPALIRRGRMDKHIELSYCCFEAFKVLARNYLDLESHDLFERIGKLLEETKMSPADVAENLMPKSNDEDADACLANLIDAIEKAKEEAKAKAEEEEKEREKERVKDEEEKRLKAEKEEKEKEEKEQKSGEGVKEEKTRVEEVRENGVRENGVKVTN